MKEPTNDSPFTPDVCNVCGNPLPPEAKACSSCGTVYTPDAKSAEDKMEETIKDGYKEADPSDTDELDKVQAVDELLDDPEVKDLLIQKLNEE